MKLAIRDHRAYPLSSPAPLQLPPLRSRTSFPSRHFGHRYHARATYADPTWDALPMSIGIRGAESSGTEGNPQRVPESDFLSLLSDVSLRAILRLLLE